MKCPRCGQNNPDQSDRCVACGVGLSDDSITPTRITSTPAPDRPAGAGRPPGPEPDRSAIGTVVSGTPLSGPQGGFFQSLVTLEPGDRLANRYEITSVLGTGGMGVVYRARDLTLDRDVALKVIRPDMAEHASIMDRFRREILLASRITHKNILRIHDLVESDGLSYISMNFVDGENLEDLLEREGALSPERALDIAIQVARALQAAHEAGVVHRDLKPQNILLDRDGVAYIADFGLSRSLEHGRTMTETGMILGTFNYMSPEQARGETHDHRGDIYAFGLILYEMLTGELPFRAEGGMSSMLKRVHEEAPKVTKVRRGVPAWLAGIISRTLKRDPGARYQSAADLLADLEARRASWAIRQMLRPKKLARLAAMLAGIAVIAAATLFGVRFLLKERTDRIVAPKASLIVLPFRNGTGNPGYDWVRTGLPNMIHTDLNQSRALRLVSEDRVQGVLEGLQVTSDGEFRADTIRRISNVLEVDNILTGQLMKAGDRFRIEAVIRNVVGDRVTPGPPIQVEGQGEESLFSMVDELTGGIRSRLGVSPGWGEQDLGITEMSTASIEALRLYEEGLSRFRIGDNMSAATSLESAVKADPGFAIARALLAQTYARQGLADRAREESEQAVQSLGSATPFEAARVRAVQAQIGNDLEKAEKAFRSLVDMAPNNAEVQFSLASVEEDLGNLDAAYASYLKAVELDPRNPEAHFALGRIKVKQGNPEPGIQDFNTALAIQVQMGNQEGRAKVLNGLGFAYDDLGQYDEAMRYYREAYSIQETIGDRRGMGSALNNMAVVYLHQGRYEEALETENRALGIGHEIGDEEYLGSWYSNLGDIFQEAGRPEDALEAFQESLKYVRNTGDEFGLAWNLSNIGYINSSLGKYLEAFFFQKEALEKRRELGDKGELLQSLIGVGYVEQVQGRYEEALKYYLEGLSLAREIKNREGIIVLQANLSNIYEDQGEFGSALRSVDEALQQARDIGYKKHIATCLAYMGTILRQIGDRTGAREALDEAILLAKEIPVPNLVARIQTDRAVLNRNGTAGEESLALLLEAVANAETAKDFRIQLMTRMRLAEERRSFGDLETVKKESKLSGLAPLLTATLMAQAELLKESGDSKGALDGFEAVIANGTPLKERDLLFQAHHQAGLILLNTGDEPGAYRHLSEALGFLEEMVEDLPADRKKQFLSRPETARYLTDAGRFFRDSRHSEETARLDSLSGT